MKLYRVEQLCFAYASGREILKDVSFSFSNGELLSILGPNGAGKSTLLNCLSGLLRPSGGKIHLGDVSITALTPQQIAKRVAYVRQSHTPSFDYTVMQFVVMGRAADISLFGKPGSEDLDKAHQILSELGIAHLESRPYTRISGGERQQATIARAIMQNPQVLLLDEPTSHLDYGNQIRSLEMIRRLLRRGYGVIMTTHNPDHALLLGGKAAILDKSGHLLWGDARQVITEHTLQTIYQSDIKLVHIPQCNRTACVTPGLTETA